MFNIAEKTHTQTFYDLFNGKQPTKMLVAFCDSRAQAGDFNYNPFNFKDWSIRSLNVSRNGLPIPQGPLELNVQEGDYLTSYLNLFRGSQMYRLDRGNDIPLVDYPFGNCIFSICFEEDGCDMENDTFPSVSYSNVRLSVSFAEALPTGVTMIVVGYFPKYFQVDYTRNIYLT